VIGDITGLAFANDTDNDETAIGIDSLTVYAGAGNTPGDGAIGDITGQSFNAEGSSIGINNSQFTAGSYNAAGGSGSIGDILAGANSGASTAFAIRGTNFEATDRIASLTTQQSGSGGTGAGGSFFRSNAFAAAVGFAGGARDVSIGSSVDGNNNVLNYSAGNYGIRNIADNYFLLGGVDVSVGSSVDQYNNGGTGDDLYTS
jgi:hypothetical protein